MKHFYWLLLSFLVLGTLTAQPGLDYYWVGTASNGVQGSGNWTDVNAWRIGSLTGTIPTQVPVSNNNVYFMAGAFPTALPGTTPVEITISNSVNCDTFYWDAAVPTLAKKIVFQTTTPGSTGPTNINLDVYGTFNLPDSSKIDFDFNGSLRFRSIDPLCTITTNGNKLLVRQVVFEGSDTTEFRLMDFFYVDDPLEYHYSYSLNTHGGFCQFVNGYLNFNGQDAVLDRFRAVANNNATRRLNIANSHIRLIGHANQVWALNFNTAGTNYASFDATGSHLLVSDHRRLSYAQQLWLGSVTYDSITIDTRYYSLIRRYNPTINHLFARTETRFYENMNLTINNLYLQGGVNYSFHYGNNARPKLILDQVTVTSQCHEYALIRGWGNTLGHIGTQVPGATLTLDKLILSRVEGDITTGSSYVANNSVDAGANVNWTINAGTGRDMRFQFSNPSTNRHRWHNISNWQEWNGATWIAATCLPTPNDNVFFDNASFPATGNHYMRVDSVAYCHDMRWHNNVSNRIWFEPYLYNDHTLRHFNIFGTIELAPNMNVSCYNRLLSLWGSDPDSIITNDVFVGNRFQIQPHSDYEIIGDLTSYGLLGVVRSTIRSKNNRLNLGFLNLYTRFLDSVEVHISADNAYAFRDVGGFQLATAYTGNTTFYFWGDDRYNRCNLTPNNINRVYLYGSSCRTCSGNLPPMHLPNTVFKSELYGLTFHMTVHGDLSFDHGARFHHWSANNYYFTQIRVLGDQPNGNYNGDMNLAPSGSYVFDSYYSNWYPPTSTNAQYNSFVEVAGTLNGTGTCQVPVIIRTLTGNPMTWRLNQTNLSFAFVEGMENTGPTATFNNSIDGSGNSNVTFNTVGTGTTFYWRAHHSNPTDFEGDWSDPAHWTTNPASLVGDSACVPSILDTAIMDGLSFSAGSNGVTIDNVGLCRTLWIRDDIQLLSTNLLTPSGHLFINESLLIDVALTRNNYSGQISFIGLGGTIRTSGTVLVNNLIDLRSSTATWDLDDAFTLENRHNARHGFLRLSSGTLRTNSHAVDLYNGFVSRGNETRRLELGNSQVTLHCLGRWIDNRYTYPWFIPNGSRNISIDGRNSSIRALDNMISNTNAVFFYMGYDSLALRTTLNNGNYRNHIHYGTVHIDRSTLNSTLYGYANYQHLHLNGNTYVPQSNVMDSIEFEGGHVYRFNRNTKQHLRSPYGKIISNGSASNFVTLETTPVGQTSYFHKEWGDHFCLDYIKVRDNIATKGINPNTGVADSDLYFYTGTTSDNINGSAQGIWNFSLVFSSHTASAPVVTVCEDQDSADVELYITGNDYYDIRYS